MTKKTKLGRSGKSSAKSKRSHSATRPAPRSSLGSTGNTGPRKAKAATSKPAPARSSASAKRRASDKPTDYTSRDHPIEVIARGVLVRQGQVLLCRPSNPAKAKKNSKGTGSGGEEGLGGYWYLPGGHVEFGEPAATALAREFAEECTLPVRVLEPVQVDEHAFATRKRPHHEINILFHVEPAPGTSEKALRAAKSREASIEFAWVDLAAVVDLAVVPHSAKAYLVSGGDVGDAGGAGSGAGAMPSPQWVSDMPSKSHLS